jgi:hypothetical protein
MLNGPLRKTFNLHKPRDMNIMLCGKYTATRAGLVPTYISLNSVMGFDKKISLQSIYFWFFKRP